MEEIEPPKRKISKWVIGGSILAAVAVTVGVTAYYVKRKRNEELKNQRYMTTDEGEGFMGKIGRYWRTTVDTFNVLKTYLPSYSKKSLPLVDSQTSKQKEISLVESEEADW